MAKGRFQPGTGLNRGWDQFMAGSTILEPWTSGSGLEPAGSDFEPASSGFEPAGSGSFYEKKQIISKIQKMQVTTLYKILHNFLLLVVYFIF